MGHWVLIIFLMNGSTTSVGGFPSREMCMAGGEREKPNYSEQISYICVEN